MWLRTTNIKQNWERNIITFRRGKTKIDVSTEERTSTTKDTTLLYAKGVHILDGPANDEVDHT